MSVGCAVVALARLITVASAGFVVICGGKWGSWSVCEGSKRVLE